MTSTASDAPIAHVEAEQPGLDAGDEPARIARPLRDLVERAADDGPLDVVRLRAGEQRRRAVENREFSPAQASSHLRRW